MKTIKPMKLGILTRCFERERKCYFSVGILGFFRFGDPSSLLSEVAMWKFLPEELGAEQVDVGMPKLGGEFLVKGSAFPPGGRPATTCPVRVSVGGLSRQLYVIGDRHWVEKRQTDPQPFTEMPISWETAYGGPELASNPLGKGHRPVETPRGPIQVLPNVELPGKLISSPKQAFEPACFRGIDYTWPQRFSKLGTYDKKWLEQGFPGFARDIDWTIWNAASPDQRQPNPFVGDERFLAENMHPEKARIEGRLPGVRARCFVTQRLGDADRFEEIDTRLTTVWLFPHAECGVLVFHGSKEIQEDDGHDIVHLVLGAEALGQSKPVSHYQQVLEQRLDKEKGALAALREGDLLPPAAEGESHGILDGIDDPAKDVVESEGLLRKNMERRTLALVEAKRDEVAKMGLDPDEYAPLPEPAPEPPSDPAALVDFLEEQTRKTEALKEEAEQKRAEEEARLRRQCEEQELNYEDYVDPARSGPPIFSAAEQIQKLEALAQQGRDEGTPIEAVEAMLRDGSFLERIQSQELEIYRGYRRLVHRQKPAIVTDAVSRSKREWVVDRLQRGESLRGADLTGADLSGLDLAGRDLSATFFESANLEGANLRGALLTQCVLAHANLRGADLSQATLVEASLGGADLTDANLQECDLTQTILAAADLSRANLSRAKLVRSDFTEARFDNTTFEEVVAEQLILMKVQLKGSSFERAQLKSCNFLESNLDDLNFRGATLSGCVFLQVQGSRADFSDAQMSNVRFVMESAFEGGRFQGANLDSANLRGTRLRGADFSGASLRAADLSEADLEDAILQGVLAQEALFIRTCLKNANLLSANLMGCLLQKADIRGADMRGANLFAADFARVHSDSRTNVRFANQKRVRSQPRRQA
jgi:uncharacterized protein YjbI with pentapeptide repeats